MAENSPLVAIELFSKVHGFLTLPEAKLLFSLVLEVPIGGNVVEVGSYQGRSTIAMALAAKQVGSIMWAIDPHTPYEASGTYFGMADNACYYRNLADFEVGGVVKTLNISSDEAFIFWNNDIDFLFIDGDHAYESVHKDFVLWSMFTDIVALHDTAGHHEGVTRLVDEILASGKWEQVHRVDSLSVFKRIEKNG